MGVFCTVVPGRGKRCEIETLASAKPVETDRVNGAVSVLLGHIIATRSSSDLIVDGDVEVPSDWRTAGTRSSTSGVGHQESGATVAIHSLAVAPHVQGCGIGQLLMKSYLQQINNSGIATRVVLVCQGVNKPRTPLIFRASCLPACQPACLPYLDRSVWCNID